MDCLTGAQRIAVLLLAMGDNFTAKVLQRMDRSEIAAISQAIVDLPPVPQKTVKKILHTFHTALCEGVDTIYGGSAMAKRMLVNNTDSDTAKYIIALLDLEHASVPFQNLRHAQPQMLAQMLSHEHPQTIALILGHIDIKQAAAILDNLPADVRAEVLLRLSNLQAVPTDVLEEMDSVLQNQIVHGKKEKKAGGVQAVATILAAMNHTAKDATLAEIEKNSAHLAQDIRQYMFVFDDCRDWNDALFSKLIQEVSHVNLTMALRGASAEVREHFFKNMSEATAKMIREDLLCMGPTKLADVQLAQQHIAHMAQRLYITSNMGAGCTG